MVLCSFSAHSHCLLFYPLAVLSSQTCMRETVASFEKGIALHVLLMSRTFAMHGCFCNIRAFV